MPISASALKGIWPAIPTPMLEQGQVDEAGLKRLVDRLIEDGVSGIVPIGGTGEYTALAPVERTRMVAVTVEAAAGRVPVVPGVLSPGFAEAREAGRDFLRAGADGLMVIAPFYIKPTQEGIGDWYRQYRDAVDTAVLLYDIPYRTGTVTAPETIARLADEGVVVGMKACNTDIVHFSRVMEMTDDRFSVLSGEDWFFPTHRVLGARGGVLATASLLGKSWVDIDEALEAGRTADALALHRRLSAFLRAVFAETNPGPLKKAFELAGRPIGAPRMPLRPCSPETAALLAAALEELGSDLA